MQCDCTTDLTGCQKLLETLMNYAFAITYAFGLIVLVMDLLVWRPL
jgi:hypothetical protein